jgi:bleomycin hydrolase
MQPCSPWFNRFWWSILALCLINSASGQTLADKVRETLERTPCPKSVADFQPLPHLPCLNQGKTYVCWSFATASFLESEMARLKLDSVRLSVAYPVYCAFLEKARRFVRTKGESRFAAGDLFTGVFDVCREYGAMPAAVYDKPAAGGLFDQTRLYAELDSLMAEVKAHERWNETRVLSQVRKILNRHLGEPPKTFSYSGKTYTPKSFLAEIVRLPWNEYLMLTSFESAPFGAFTELKVPDNWRHNTNFLNVPLAVFYDALKGALRSGCSAAIDLDNTEPSYKTTGRYCVIPDFDIPAGSISQAARELRFLSSATTDDHAIHMIGFSTFGGEDWFLAKDSGKAVWRDGNQGVLFLHGPYVKLKVLAYLVHRDGVPQATALLPDPSQGRAR